MRQGALYAPSLSVLNPSSPSPSSSAAAAANHTGGMLLSVFLALFLPCAGMSALFVVYICLLWFASNPPPNSAANPEDLKPPAKKGLSAAELSKLPEVAAKELPMGNECAVCLDDIEPEQIARRIPVCNHGFHIECADRWLAKHPFCPVCRGKIDRELLVVDPDGGDGEDSPV